MGGYILFNNQAANISILGTQQYLQNCSSTCTFQLPHGSILQQDLGLFRSLLCRKETKSHRRKKKWEHFPKSKVKELRYTTVIPSPTSLQSCHEFRKSLCSDNFIFSHLLLSLYFFLLNTFQKQNVKKPSISSQTQSSLQKELT